ncbi:MAG: type I-E CRISPR-associated protein Cas7/Cse4/CasC [Opitutales bacterium]
MKLVELHILQSFPVSCLNRDDVGSPKSAVFGGVPRARISSQCLKRPNRLDFNESHFGNRFHTERTKLAHKKLAQKMIEKGLTKELSNRLALEILSKLVDKKGAAKAKADKSGRINMPALIWLSPAQIESAAEAAKEAKDKIIEALEKAEKGGKKEEKESEKAIKAAFAPITKAIRDAGISDAPDIALFGRMVANDPSLNVEGAAMFSHALSTHKVSNEIDFYSAVDDVKQKHGIEDDPAAEDAGAGMIGSLEFNSATYYRYIGINLDLLAAPSHLGGLSEEERKDILKAFIQAALTAVPNARKNSMNAGTRPFEVLGVRKASGQPLQLVNAFEEPVPGGAKGYANPSLEKMKAHLGKIEKVWGEQGEKHWLTEEGLENFINNLLAD